MRACLFIILLPPPFSLLQLGAKIKLAQIVTFGFIRSHSLHLSRQIEKGQELKISGYVYSPPTSHPFLQFPSPPALHSIGDKCDNTHNENALFHYYKTIFNCILSFIPQNYLYLWWRQRQWQQRRRM